MGLSNPRRWPSLRRVGQYLDFFALGLGLPAVGWMITVWIVALSGEADVVRLYVNRYREGVFELVLWCVIAAFIVWRWLAFWWRMFRR